MSQSDGFKETWKGLNSDLFQGDIKAWKRLFETRPVSEEDLEKVKDVGESLGIQTFEGRVRLILSKLGDMLIEKNQAYGNSALEPVRIFSRANTVESLNVRIDDKLSRLSRGHEYPGDDTIDDLIGYLVLLKIAREDER